MKSFSQRRGIKPIKKIQIDSMDDDLRTGLWNALTIFYWEQELYEHDIDNYEVSHVIPSPNIYILLRRLWDSYLKRTLDNLNDWPEAYSVIGRDIKKHFFECQWYEVYDFIEFVANNYPDESVNQKFMDYCNNVLERELSAYSFIGGIITQITSKEEISEIEEALKVPISQVRKQLNRSLELLSDRKNPDYRNSIKEAISAVESLCNLIIGEKATLGQALKEVEKNIAFHPALKKAFSHLYGYQVMLMVLGTL